MAWDDPLTAAVNDVLWCLVSSWYYLLVLIIPGNSQGRVCGDLLKLSSTTNSYPCLCSRKAILDKCILLVIRIFDLIFSFEMKMRKSWLFWFWFCDFYQLLLSFITVGRFKVQAKSDVKLWQKSLKFDWFFLHEVLKNYIRTLSS